jgi:UDP-N-acetylglucosamine--N-acetylmuramyl-(pentapeptide) pyrophosphoryl-undecaprenol N-acetylglucosamine transferase
MQKSRRTIVMTGGHGVTTAVATLQELLKEDKDRSWAIHWIGTKENSLFPADLGVHIYIVASGKLHRKFNKSTLLDLLKIPVGFWQSFNILQKIKPDLIVSYGGHTALPVVIIGFLKGIPSVLHEQTVAAGLANRLSANFVNKIAISRQESKEFFPRYKTIVTGNPVRAEILAVTQKKKLHSPPTLFIIGGSRGAHNINKAVEGCLLKLLGQYRVIHLTGQLDFEHHQAIKESLPANIANRYDVHSVIDARQMADTYTMCDIVVARAGANTVSEVMSIKVPAIFIPIPWVQHNEQHKNAKLAESSGIATILPQSSLTPKRLFHEIRRVTRSWQSIVNNADVNATSIDREAAKNMVSLIKEYL